MLIPWLPDLAQECFCTPDGAMGPTFQIKYVPSRFVFDLMEILDIKQITFFFEASFTKGDSRKFQGCVRSISRVFQESF